MDTPIGACGRLTARSRIALLALALLVTPTVAAQENDIWKTVFEGRAEVNVVNVDVVVTDKEGQPVEGLTAADFELFVDGQPVPISNFYTVTGGRATLAGTGEATSTRAAAIVGEDAPAATPDERPLHLILYVDNANIAATNRARALDRLRDFLLENRELGAKMMLLSNDRSLVLHQGLTSTPHEIFVALDGLEKAASVGSRFDADRREIIRALEGLNVEKGSDVFSVKGDEGRTERQMTYDVVAQATPILTRIRAYTAERTQHTRDTLGVLRQLIDTAAGMPGRKAVVYVSDGIAVRPGAALYEGFARRVEPLGPMASRLSPESEASRDDLTPDLDELVRHANASRVTFYALDASPAASLEHMSAAAGNASAGNFGSWNDSMASTEQLQSQESLRRMASGTGGRFAAGASAFKNVLRSLAADFDQYYSLGFNADAVAETEKDGRSIEVELRRRGLVAHHRSSYRDKQAAELAAERARAALLLDGLDNPLRVELAAGEAAEQDDGTFVVPLSVRIPIAGMVLLPGETAHQGQLSMYVAVRDEKGRSSDVQRHLCPIRIPNADVLTALGRKAACGVRLLMRPGPQRIAVAVLDELTSQASTVHLSVDIPAGVRQAALETGAQ